MKKKLKRTYVTPVTDVVEVDSERILCMSSPQLNTPFGGMQNWDGSAGPDLNLPFGGSQEW